MAILTTYYDYELKKEAYKLTGEKGYARSTSTLLDFVSVTDTTMDYCTATFTVNVLNDRGESQVAIYDNGVLIPFTYNGSEVTYLDWSNQQTSSVTITIKLSYETTHKLQAKYLANRRCVPSKSKIVELIKEKPATARTTLAMAFGHTNRIYTASETLSCTATLSIVDNSINPTANRSQPIKFYVDGVLNGSANTNNSGVASYTFSNVGVGLHTVTAVYEGSDYLFNTETSTEISRGYKVDVTSYPTYVLNSGNISVSAHLSDFFDNALSSKTLYLANSSNTSLGVSATTNSGGNATITMDSSKYSSIQTGSNNVYSVPYKVRYSANEYSDTITTSNATNMVIELDDVTEYVTAKNQSIEIMGLVSPQRSVFPVDVTVTANGSSKTVKTNSNGAFSYLYDGVGGGSVTVTANINGANDSITVEDVLQYWRANRTSWNKKYGNLIGEFRELSNGFKLSTEGTALLGLGDGSAFSNNYELTFTIVGASSVYSFGIGQWTSSSPFSGVTNTNISLKGGDVIKAVKQNGLLTVYKNNVSMSSITVPNGYPVILIGRAETITATITNQYGGSGTAIVQNPNTTAYLIFDDLKFKVI